MSTIFTQIVEGEIPARIVYEDETTVAFLDANPLAPGHTLVIPKDEYERLNDVPADVATDLYDTIHRLVPVVEDVVDADATTVAFNNGEEAGQEVPHVHCHIVPRFEGDGGGPIHAIAGEVPDLDDDELDAIAADIESEA
ncbi:histidine triad family protein (homolog to bis(5'-nucleosyl)-tetraphosphatase) [Natrialba magadii ATCC 43099]|uniref:Histidine triad (HIT) protein n=1 Tax=Natrialba magadii (strain ATCC 43099 / DSM 3394 / CCM 3739 / CIP 104546 / IAM 13178 / JCM 8861 / NBRC 102185 / NCIMB 2190 / MS3) TaxID=547559 RepID=D3SUR5_NATMM|nr:HIT family protein [Natrialba magadii]ADD05323.1 histidine triad family protein (homolog to bis(5'-nucleosyl)-tetraphosphatase) [Natrialba magadii ATCC 43099]ELY29359.1 histidine triad (HIT) protein [Natrialba magadii ATCC 43099]